MKSWRGDIEEHVARWGKHCGERNVKWWPKFAYHFTYVTNAASILEEDRLLSREQAQSRERMINENAASTVIAETPLAHQRFARLYFRPRTPTQYHNEGIRPPGQRYQAAHCPVPIFFCFDLVELLAQDEVSFSDGSMGRPEVRYGNSRELFCSIPFDLVYHDRSIGPDEDNRKITFHRHAEVLVPGELPLTHLAGMACRTDAEKRTLLHLLPNDARARWRQKIVCVGDPLFFRDRTHVDSVYGVDGTLHVRFNASPFRTKLPVEIRARSPEGRSWSWQGEHHGSSELTIEFPPDSHGELEIEVRLFDAMAFRALVWLRDELPF